EWNWQALANTVNSRWGLKTGDRELKKIGKDNLAQHLIAGGEKAVEAIDLSAGRPFLEEDWGPRSLCDWAKRKFRIELTVDSIKDVPLANVADMLKGKVRELYREREVEFPVQVGMARFMADRSGGPGGGQRYDREGLYYWAKERFPGLVVPAGGERAEANGHLTEEDFRTLSRARLNEHLVKASRERFPKHRQDEIDEKLQDSFRGTKLSEAEDAKEV